jgi:hypothetical protein
MINIARSVVLTSLLSASCAFEVTDKPDPVHCSLSGLYCNCTGTVDTAESLSDAQEQCNRLRDADGGTP